MGPRHKNFAQKLLVPLWGLMVCGGMFQLQRYENTPNPGALPPAQFPGELSSLRKPECPTLLIFVHPWCPCSTATIGELERLVARLNPEVLIHVVFWHPDGLTTNWHESALWRQACRLPRINLIDDVGCIFTQRFGVMTSGQTVLYDASGRLQFAGGITMARGHAGDNSGSDRVLSMAETTPMPGDRGPICCQVFGCPLQEAENRTATLESKR